MMQFKKYRYTIAGVIIGSLAGYLYYKYVGCINGSCPVTSNPVLSTLYGAFMGGILMSVFNTRTKQTPGSNGN